MSHDLNKDGEVDIFDQQAEWRRQDQEDSARAVREIGATLGQGVRNLGAAFAGLWRNVTSLPGRVLKVARRAHVRLVVQLIPEDVTDADTLYDLTWQIAPADATDEHYRRTICVLATKERTAEEDAQFVQYLRGCKAYGQDPIRTWIERARARRTVRALPPRATVEPASMPMGFAAMPAAPMLFTPVTQVLAVLLALAVMFGLWKDGQAKDAARYRDALRNEQQANEGLGARVIMAEEALQESRIAQEAYEKKIADQQARDAALAARTAAILRREKERQNAIRNSSGGVSDDDLLRELAQPAADLGNPVPADPAAAAPEGVLHEVPGAPGGDAATDAGPDR